MAAGREEGLSCIIVSLSSGLWVPTWVRVSQFIDSYFLSEAAPDTHTLPQKGKYFCKTQRAFSFLIT